MQVSSSPESIICFNLKYAIDFEKMINIAKKKEDFQGSLSVAFQCGCSVVQFSGDGHDEMALLGGHRDSRPVAVTQ